MRLLTLAFVLFASFALWADLSPKVIAAFKGQIVITRGDLPEGRNDKDAIAKIKAARVTEIAGQTSPEGGMSWTFHYTAFPGQTGGANLHMVFSEGGRTRADRQMSVDPKSPVFSGEVTIGKDDGIERGKLCTIELTNGKKTLAQTKVLFK